jgi:hypothetical protein
MVAGRGSVAEAPQYRRALRLLRRRSGGVARVSFPQWYWDHHVDRHGLSEIEDCPIRAIRRQFSVTTCVRARLDLLHANVESGRAFRRSGAILRRAERLLQRRSNASLRQRADGRGSRVDGR